MAKELKQFVEFYNLDALIARDIPQPLQEGEITIAGLRHRAGIGHEVDGTPVVDIKPHSPELDG